MVEGTVIKVRRLEAFLLLVLLLGVSGCNLVERRHQAPSDGALPTFKHIVVMVQENRSFDNMFSGFPGSDSAKFGLTHNGRLIPLKPISMAANYDINHSYRDFMASLDNGRMDGFDLPHAGSKPGAYGPPPPGLVFPQYGVIPRKESRPYWALAKRFGLADAMFQSNYDQSFGAHLFLIAGTADGIINVPNGHPWGCDSPPKTTVRRLPVNGVKMKPSFPCVSLLTLGDLMNRRGITWAYYAPRVNNWNYWKIVEQRRARRGRLPRLDLGQLWSAYDAIPNIRYGPSWQDNIISPETSVISDIRKRRLPQMSWVIPDFVNSDHSGSHSVTGPAWIGAVCDEIGMSPYWNDTAIVIVWDDSGGWYDHVPPPRIDSEGDGFRVPMIVVSRYSRPHFVSHRQRDFGSILRFAEKTFSLPALSTRDARADDLSEFFDSTINLVYRRIYPSGTADRILRSKPTYIPPDSD